MSAIYVTSYDDDPEEYNHSNKELLMGFVDEEKRFTDGEELDAAAYVLDLMAVGLHFDVRREIN